MQTYTLRQSELKGYKACRRAWQLGYVRGLVLKRGTEKVSVADTGTMFHLGLEGHYAAGVHPRHKLDAYWREVPEAEKEKYAKNYKLAGVMLDGYQQLVVEEGWDTRWAVKGVERQIAVPFGVIEGANVVVTGKVDLEVEDVNLGTRHLVDHKSVAGIEDERVLQVDDQLLTYAVLRRLEDDQRITSAIHNQAKRVLRSGAAKPPFYGRSEVSFNDDHLRKHWRHMHAVMTEMVKLRQMIEAGDPAVEAMLYPNPGKDCSWKCRFLPVCPMMDDGSDAEGFLAQWYEISDTVEDTEKEER